MQLNRLSPISLLARFKFWKHFRWLLLGILAAIACIFLTPSPARTQIGDVPVTFSELPTTEVIIDGEVARVPDFSQIALGDIAVDSAGAIDNFEVGLPDGPTSVNSLMGYEFSRVWEEGAPLSEVLRFGDIEASFEIGEFIPSLSGHSLGDLNLDEIADLAGATELLGSLPLNQIEFLEDTSFEDLVEADILSSSDFFEDGFEIAGLKDKNFGSLGNTFTVSDLPALEDASLKEFPGIQDYFIRGIPFLDRVPLSAFLDSVNGIARLDALYGCHPEGRAELAISGSGPRPAPQEPEDCDGGNCPHAEVFFPPGNFAFGRWVSGQAQKVEGGFGPLQVVGGGMEPTGRMPFGSRFKVVLWKIDESIDRVETRIFFRVCKTIPFFGRTCTPYNLPPQGIQFFEFSRDDYLPA